MLSRTELYLLRRPPADPEVRHDFELILQFYRDLIAKKTSEPLGEELGFLLEMYCQGSVYMTAKWVLVGFDMPPEKMARILVEAMPPRVAAVFDKLGLL